MTRELFGIEKRISLIVLLLIMYEAYKSDQGIIFKTCAAIIIFVLVVTFVYEIVYLTEERESST
ncbi:MAG: hypothetical protein ABIQ31_23395 [Ferruginibacter sp.]